MVVVLVLPVADDDLCVQQRVEVVDVEALVADPAVERLDVPVAPRRARRDVGQAGAGAGPVGHRLADELRPVVRPEHRRGAPGGDEVLEVGGESVGGNRALHEAADALPGVFVDDRADLDQSSVLVGVELEVHRPHHVRRVRRRRVDGRGPDALASTPLRDPEPFVTPQALDLLVVHHPPLGAGVVIRPPIPVAGMVLRPGAQPLPERPIRVRDRVALERSPVRGAAQPDQTARHPFAHPQLALEVIDGGAAPVRA